MTVPLEDEPCEPPPVPVQLPVQHLYQAYVQTIIKMVYSADCEITSVASLKGGCVDVMSGLPGCTFGSGRLLVPLWSNGHPTTCR